MFDHKEDRVDQILSFLKEKYGVNHQIVWVMGKKEFQIETKKTDLTEEEIENIGYKAVDYTGRHSLLVNNNRKGLEQ